MISESDGSARRVESAPPTLFCTGRTFVESPTRRRVYHR
jgi:hypothetical protein